jgi:hypothetical protein
MTVEFDLIFGVLTPLQEKFRFYLGTKFNGGKKPVYRKEAPDLNKATDCLVYEPEL